MRYVCISGSVYTGSSPCVIGGDEGRLLLYLQVFWKFGLDVTLNIVLIRLEVCVYRRWKVGFR
jgi:hypothetical protein